MNTDAERVKHLTFLGRILDPFIETYWLTCVSLSQEEEGRDIQGGRDFFFLVQLYSVAVGLNFYIHV